MMKKAKRLFLTVCFTLILVNYAWPQQADTVSFWRAIQFRGVTGCKIFNPYGDFNPIYEGAAYFPFVAGLETYSPDLRISLDLRQAFMTSLSARDTNFDIAYTRKTSTFGLTYHLKRKNSSKRPIRVGLGFNLIRTGSEYEALLGASPYMKGGMLFIGLPVEWLDVEFRAEPDQEDVISADKFSVAFIYRFGRKDTVGKHRAANVLNLLVALHASLNRNYYAPNSWSDMYSPIMTLPEIGLEYVFVKYNIALQARRNVWIGIAGGDKRYDINGYTEQLYLGGSRIRNIKRGSLKYGVSHVWMRDMGRFNAPTPGAAEFYPERGISLNASYPIRKVDIEGRAMYAYHINKYITSSVVNPFDRYRLSLGIVYRINPLK